MICRSCWPRRKEGWNNFPILTVLTELSEREDTRLIYNEHAIALIYDDNGVTRLYLDLSSLEAAPALRELLGQICARPIIIDCVGSAERVEEVSLALCTAGFAPYAHLRRLRNTNIQYHPEADAVIQPALPEDCEPIFSLLCETFDPYVSHLPSREKLLRLINDQLVYRIVENGEIAAVQCLERTGTRGLYIYQTLVAPPYRGRGLGTLVIPYIPGCCAGSCSFFTVWVIDGNERSIRVLQRSGAVFDGLEDTVLIFR